MSLSSLPVPPEERLIFALDVPSLEEARALIEHLDDSVRFYKIGLELCMSGGYFELLELLHRREKKIFADLKFFDVPQTVSSAVKGLAKYRPTFATVHGNDAVMRAAAEAKGEMKILAVTALTSLDEGDLKDLGFECSPERLVLSRARRALECGCDGVISSGLEAPALRRFIDGKLLVICPGVRPVANREDDQKRTVDIKQAFENGADYIVVGRPIRLHEGHASPREAASAAVGQIRELFETYAS